MSGLPAPDDPAASALESMSTQAALARILSLPPDRAEAILLRVVIGVDAKSAARILGKRPGAVRMAACRGLRQLAADLQETTEEPEPVLRAGVTQPGLSTLT
jgi:RNA polymerase sigma-70 factor (ECF subfamily)